MDAHNVVTMAGGMIMSRGLLHLYIGDGQGKTSAAVGLATRSAGGGMSVVFAQFLKGNNTGEVVSLETLGAKIFRSGQDFGFVWDMSAGQRDEFRKEQGRILTEVCSIFGAGGVQGATSPTIIVLDEVLDAITMNLVDEGLLRDFIDNKREGVELVLTGHEAPDWVCEIADYITVMKKVKHPYDKGVEARAGIEF